MPEDNTAVIVADELVMARWSVGPSEEVEVRRGDLSVRQRASGVRHRLERAGVADVGFGLGRGAVGVASQAGPRSLRSVVAPDPARVAHE